MPQLVEIEHSTVSGTAWVPLGAFTEFWGPIEGWTLVAEGASSYLPAPMRWRGTYSAGVQYAPGDVVSSAGILYIALVPVFAVAPASDPTKWAIATAAVDSSTFAVKGDAASAGALATDALLKAWVSGDSYELLSVVVDADDVMTTATVKWPDGSGGVFTTSVINATFKLVDAFTVSHTLSGKVVTQAAVTRNATGAVTTFPALTVA